MTNTKKNLISSKLSSKLHSRPRLSNNPMMLMKLHNLHKHLLSRLSSLKDNTVYIKMLTCLKKKKMWELGRINRLSIKHHLHNKVNYFLEWVELDKVLLLKNNNHHHKILLTSLMKVHKIKVMSLLIRKILQQVSMDSISVSLLLSSNNNLRKPLMFQLLKFQILKKLPNISRKNKQAKMPGTNLSSNLVQKLNNGLEDKRHLEATKQERKITLRYYFAPYKTCCGKAIPGIL